MSPCLGVGGVGQHIAMDVEMGKCRDGKGEEGHGVIEFEGGWDGKLTRQGVQVGRAAAVMLMC
jgi:hypothetical protein